MTIKSLLIGSAAAIAAVSGAQAADAIVAAEPEAVEYVRVCDSFGAGFFYIPGSETCLKVSGLVRFQTNFAKNVSAKAPADAADWDSFSRAQLTFEARNESELGTIRSVMILRGNADQTSDRGVNVEEAFIDVAGARVGKFLSIWDNGLSGDTDVLANNVNYNSIRYAYDAGAFVAGVSVDELEGVTGVSGNQIGVAAHAAAKIGAVSVEAIGGYDFNVDEYALRAIATAQVGPGVAGISAVYASAANTYFKAAEWAVAAEYAVNVTDKIKVAPGVQYFNDYDFAGKDAWKAGVTADYAITSGLSAKAHLDVLDVDGKKEVYTGFVRLNRAF